MGAAEQLTEPWTYHGEGPVWDPGPGLLRWVDLYAGDVLSLAPQTQHVQRSHVGTVAAALRPRVGGGLVVAVERGFCLLRAEEAEPRPLGEVWADPTVRMNDGGCDPQGRFYCGSMAYDAAPARGALYCLEPDGAVRRVLDGVTISNGIAWSRDGTQVYYVDSPTQRVDVFDFDPDSGAFTNRRAAVEVDPDHGMPDPRIASTESAVWVHVHVEGNDAAKAVLATAGVIRRRNDLAVLRAAVDRADFVVRVVCWAIVGIGLARFVPLTALVPSTVKTEARGSGWPSTPWLPGLRRLSPALVGLVARAVRDARPSHRGVEGRLHPDRRGPRTACSPRSRGARLPTPRRCASLRSISRATAPTSPASPTTSKSAVWSSGCPARIGV